MPNRMPTPLNAQHDVESATQPAMRLVKMIPHIDRVQADRYGNSDEHRHVVPTTTCSLFGRIRAMRSVAYAQTHLDPTHRQSTASKGSAKSTIRFFEKNHQFPLSLQLANLQLANFQRAVPQSLFLNPRLTRWYFLGSTPYNRCLLVDLT